MTTSMTRPQSEPGPRLLSPWWTIAGVATSWFGVHWDLAVHVDMGRDGLLTRPHIIVLAGAAIMLVSGWFAARRSLGAATFPPSSVMIAVGAVMVYVSLAYDNSWHIVFGEDLTVASPAHLVLMLAFLVALVGGLLSLVEQGTSPVVLCAACALVWTIPALTLIEYELGLPPFAMAVEPVLSGLLFGLVVGVATVVTGGWRAAGTVTMAFALVAATVASLANVALGYSAPVPAIGWLAAGAAYDFLRRHARLDGRWFASLVRVGGAVVVLLALVAAQRALIGRTWWTWPTLAVGLVPAIAGGVLAFHVGARIFAAHIDHRPIGTRRVGLAVLAVFGVLAFTAVPLMRREASVVVAQVERRGPTYWVSIDGASQHDWLSAFEAKSATDTRRYPRGGLAWDGQRYHGRIDLDGGLLSLWYTSGMTHWAGSVEARDADVIRLEETLFANPDRTLAWTVTSFAVLLGVLGAELVAMLRPDLLRRRPAPVEPADRAPEPIEA